MPIPVFYLKANSGQGYYRLNLTSHYTDADRAITACNGLVPGNANTRYRVVRYENDAETIISESIPQRS